MLQVLSFVLWLVGISITARWYNFFQDSHTPFIFLYIPVFAACIRYTFNYCILCVLLLSTIKLGKHPRKLTRNPIGCLSSCRAYSLGPGSGKVKLKLGNPGNPKHEKPLCLRCIHIFWDLKKAVRAFQLSNTPKKGNMKVKDSNCRTF